MVQLRLAGLLVAALALATPALVSSALVSPAHAVIGGQPENGSLAARTLIILSSNGGVCTAVVLANDVLATAAHCVTGPHEHRAHYRAADGTPVLLEIAAKTIHPQYDADAIATRRRSIDLALVRLAEPLPARFEPAILATGNVREGGVVTLAGYGTTDESDKSGRSMGTFNAVELTVVEPYGPSSILLWLSDARSTGRGGCQGDSGGPIAFGENVVALSTWTTGEGKRNCGTLSQGVRLDPQRAWIDATLQGWGRGARWQ
jgi:secreted trypsin-like serine protease